MIKKVIEFENIDGELVTDTFYFSMSMMETIEQAAIQGEDYADRIKRIVASNDAANIFAMLRDLISQTVGHKTSDGYLDKTPEITRRFMNSEAYSVLLIELINTPGAAAEFFNGVYPKNLQNKIEKFGGQNANTAESLTSRGLGLPMSELDKWDASLPVSTLDVKEDNTPVWVKEKRLPTQQEARNMSKDEMFVAMQTQMRTPLS